MKIFIKTVLILLGAVLVSFGMYRFVLAGHFANAVVSFLKLFTHDYYEALYLYQDIFRSNMDWFVLLALILVFIIILRIYLKSFVKYFNEINGALDELIDEKTDDIVLSSELVPIEKKINSVKHTLLQRKMATEIAEKRKNDLVVYLAHDLKTPLTSVIGYLTLLRDENKISDELREKYLSISLEKAERLEDLINEFFEITRFNLTNITLEYSKVNITRLLEQLTFEFKPMFMEKNLEYKLSIPPDTYANCDVNKIQRVFDNLLRNAVNYSFNNTVISITGVVKEDMLCIKFTNSGNTIPKHKLERIFEQFYRLDTARSSSSGGAGLGLAITKEIVELHGGTVSAKSENEIIEFEVSIPAL